MRMSRIRWQDLRSAMWTNVICLHRWKGQAIYHLLLVNLILWSLFSFHFTFSRYVDKLCFRSQNKLSRQERKNLQVALAGHSFMCGSPLQDLDLPGKLAHVYSRDLSYGDPWELYDTANTPGFVFTARLQSRWIMKMLTTPSAKTAVTSLK